MIILASRSPRRKDLLSQVGIPFHSEEAPVDEHEIAQRLERQASFVHRIPPAALAETLARSKAEAVFASHPDDLVIGADTIVVLGHRILGKPQDAEDARRMLRELSGHEHEVITGVCLIKQGEERIFHQRSRVRFYEPDEHTEAFIERYIAGGSPFDKAGSYGIQDEGALLIESIKGDFYNVMGLPIAKVWRELQSMASPEDFQLRGDAKKK